MSGKRKLGLKLTTAALALAAMQAAVAQVPAGGPAVEARTESAENLTLAAHDPLQSRQTYQMVEIRQGNRWLLYLGHLRGFETDPRTGEKTPNGTSVVDVTDPEHPVYLNHIPPTPAPWSDGTDAEKSGGQHVQACSGDVLPGGTRGRTYLLRNQGSIGQEVLDVTDPLKPVLVAQVSRAGRPRDGLYRTHKNFWDCATGEAYLVNSVAGWTGQVLQIFDLADPAHPRHIRDFGLPGTQPSGTTDRADGYSIHEANVLGDRVYLAYGVSSQGVVQILDRQRLLHGDPAVADPLAPSDTSLAYPQISRIDMPDYWGAHTAKPILDVPIADYQRNKTGSRRNFLFVTSEGVDFLCQSPRHISFFLDISDEKHPWPVSNFQVPALPKEPGDPDFCSRGVFGPHSPHASHNPFYEGKLVFLAYFTGGVRAIDMRDPFKPVEVGHFIAERTVNSRVIYPQNPPPGTEPWPVANTVEIDERGHYLFMADRPHNGLYILKLSDELEAIAAGKAD